MNTKLVVAILIGLWLFAGFASDVVTPVEDGDYTYVDWTGSTDSAGDASMITSRPILGQDLLLVYYVPPASNPCASDNTPVLTVDAAWCTAMTGGTQKAPVSYWKLPTAESGLHAYGSFGGSDADVLSMTGSAVSASAFVLGTVSDGLNLFDRAANFHLVMVFGPAAEE